MQPRVSLAPNLLCTEEEGKHVGSGTRVVARMEKRIAELAANFDACLQTFVKTERFTGPSWYFHQKTLALRERHMTVHSLVNDREFLDSLYATLTAWGLHRMGPGNTKLRDLGEIAQAIQEQTDALENLAGLKLTRIADAERADVTCKVWSVLSVLRISIAESRIVANSKVLHHLLPNLVPPMDRQYTFRFFYDRTNLSVSEDVAFREMFTRLLRLGGLTRTTIEAAPKSEWNTSLAKVLDNALVGYVISRLSAASTQVKLPSARN
jgi:hypothetical protein